MADMQVANQFFESVCEQSTDAQGKDREQRTASALSLDQLQHMSDLMEELRSMSAQACLGTLTGILSVAVIETNVQIKARSRSLV